MIFRNADRREHKTEIPIFPQAHQLLLPRFHFLDGSHGKMPSGYKFRKWTRK